MGGGGEREREREREGERAANTLLHKVKDLSTSRRYHNYHQNHSNTETG